MTERTVEIWAYSGKRLSTLDHKLYDTWNSPGDVPKIYSKLSGVVGGEYEITVTREGDTTTVHGQPVWSGKYVDSDQKLVWATLDYTHRTQHKQRLNHQNAKAADQLESALVPILKLARACRTKYDKDALSATIIRRISETW